MGTNQNINKSNNKEPSFDEYLAYEELRMIFVIAIETQNFEMLESRIAAWEKRYPLAEFQNPEIIRRIKAILNKDFLSHLLGDYLAAKILHEQEKQKELYDSLKIIIDKAKVSKDYKTASREVRKWKDNLYASGFSLYNFDRIYRARICTLLLLPSRELKNQEQATDELKKLKEKGNSMDSTTYFEEICKWQNKYSITDFPDKLKKELNQITIEVFDSISQKRTSENAIAELQLVLSNKDISLPANIMASILSKYDYKNFDKSTQSQIQEIMLEAFSIQENIFQNTDLSVLSEISPVEIHALGSLRDIFNKTPNDKDKLLNWIYENRKISYSEFARKEIIAQFLSAGYKIPVQSSFSIPEVNRNLNYLDLSIIDDFRKDVILNYLGLLSQGNKLTVEGKDNLIEAHAVSTKEVLIKEADTPLMYLEAFDTVVENTEPDISQDEESIYNIFIEDILDNPLATYSIKSSTINKINNDSTPDREHEVSPQVPTPAETESREKSLTNKDNENLEKAYELSTYIMIASPILEKALTKKRVRSHKKEKGIERTK